MQAQHAARAPVAQVDDEPVPFPPFDPTASTLVMDGYTAKLSVVDRQLHLEDSANGQARSITLARGMCKVSRILILARTGSISLSAVRWLQALGIHLAVLEGAGSALHVTLQTQSTRSADASLRRAQALALDEPVGVEITRYLLGAKIRGQHANLVRLGYEIPSAARLCQRIEEAKTIEACCSAESQMASTYWQCWSILDCKWMEKDRARVPEHWRTMGQRTNSRKGSPRDAVTPVKEVRPFR